MPPSTSAIGLAFENHTLRFLNGDLRMSLSHVGGRGDGGVDLRGFWWVPKPPRRRAASSSSKTASASDSESSDSAGSSSQEGGPSLSATNGKASLPWKPPIPPGLKRDGSPGARIRPLRVVAQCKAERKVQGPRVVREFEGTLAHLTAQDTRVPLFGVLASQSGFSLASMEHAVRSRVPLLLVHLEGGRPEEEVEGEGKDGGRISVGEPREGEGRGKAEAEAGEGQPVIPVVGAWWNSALGTLLSSAGVELRREVGSGTRVGVWTAGMRMGRYGTPL